MAVPEQASLQPAKIASLAEVAVKVTRLFSSYTSVHSLPQSIPLPVTLPVPVPSLLTVSE
ncbi:MAG: hypothetical protein B6247_23300 [Candidatus Parabeggiatoa sp. nov. 2]|nr:MAG: hypothetical protein B6247_23300 [Beggiatoa sp. 4572_84]